MRSALSILILVLVAAACSTAEDTAVTTDQVPTTLEDVGAIEEPDTEPSEPSQSYAGTIHRAAAFKRMDLAC